MLDQVLAWAVIFLPTALSIIFIFIPARQEDVRAHMRWRSWLVVFGVFFSVLAWWQQSHALNTQPRSESQRLRKRPHELLQRLRIE